MYEFDWSSIPGALPYLWQGMKVSLQITFIAVIFGIVVLVRDGSDPTTHDVEFLPKPFTLKQLVAAGTKLHAFPKDVMDASFKAAMELYAELNASNPAWKKIYEDFSGFRRDQNLWFRFTENRFDDFMQTQKL